MTTLSPATAGSTPASTSGVRARATMRDVAERAGVSIKTVSRVVNRERGVSAVLAERVHTAARELSYQPDLTAGNLRRAGRRTASIGLLLASVDNPFAATIHRAVEDVAERRGVAVFSASTDERPERERELVAAFTSRRVDGLIITPTGVDQRYLLPELEAGTPVVMVDRPPVAVDLDHVLSDNPDGARTATSHLLAGGHRRIAYLGDLAHIATAAERHDGYLQAMAAAGVALDPALVLEDVHNEQSALEATLRLLALPEPPTAIFASQNLITIGTIRALRARGRQHDVALVGFDDFVLADLLDPAVTVVAQDPGEIGRAAAERIFARLDDPSLPAEWITVPTRLVVRGSGEIPPHRA